MFIYTGKLSWYSSGVDELFIFVLPNGPVRVGDEIYTYSQWTKDSRGNKKAKWFSHQLVDKLVRGDDGVDTFYFGKGYYSFKVEAQNAYQTLSMTMSNPGGAERVMSFDRTYRTDGDVSTGAARIWHGSLNWSQYASDELFVAIAPEGFGATKPLLAFWQWTEDQNGQAKVNCIRKESQQAETPSEGSLKFSTTGDSDYSMTCTWDEKTEKLAMHIQGPDKYGQLDIALDLAALITFHSDEVTPPKLPGKTVSLVAHYPQAEATLARIQTPMPFPPTLVETLTHTAAFVDQAGYLAKYAVDRYHALDRSYHALNKQIDDLNAQIRDLTGQVATLTGATDDENKQLDALNKKLAETLNEAAKQQADLTAQIHILTKTLTSDQTHDAEDHKVLDEAHAQILKDQSSLTTLQKQIVQLQFALAQGATRIQQFQKKLTFQSQELSSLRGQLSAEKTHNYQLQKESTELKAKVAALETDGAATKKTLARTAEDLKQAQADSADKDTIIDGLETGLVAVTKDRDGQKRAYEDLKASSGATIQELEDEIAKLKAAVPPAGGGGGCGQGGGSEWPFPDGWPFPGDGKQGGGGCWPSPDDLLKQMSGL